MPTAAPFPSALHKFRAQRTTRIGLRKQSRTTHLAYQQFPTANHAVRHQRKQKGPVGPQEVGGERAGGAHITCPLCVEASLTRSSPWASALEPEEGPFGGRKLPST